MPRQRISHLLLAIAAPILSYGCAAPLLGGASTSAASNLAASAQATDLIANPSVMDYTADSTKIAFLAPAALTSGNRSTEASVVKEQCYFKTADPLFFVPDEAQQPTWDFVGRLDATNHFEALEYRSILTLGLTHGDVQLNSWPVELIALSDIPEVFLQQRLTLLAQAKLQPSDEHELAQQFIKQSQKLQEVVTGLESQFNPKITCPKRESSWIR